MEGLWQAIEAEARDGLEGEAVLTRAVVVFETVHSGGLTNLNRITFDAAGKELSQWTAAGLLVTVLNDLLEERSHG